jgi:parallel beta-helix repeat protein
MKTSKIASLTIIALFLCGAIAVPVHASEPTLAEQLNMTLGTVNWTSPSSWVIPHFSLIFTGQGNYDVAVPTISDFITLMQAKRMAEIDDVASPVLDQALLQALNNEPMAGHWPNVDQHVMWVYWRYLVSAYQYAVELGANTTKWNRDLAFQEFLQCWQGDNNFLWFNPANGTTTDFMNRYYDENAQVLSMFLKFYQAGIPEALDYAKQMWTHLCTAHWSGSYFPYTGTSGQVECEAGSFAEIIAELYGNNGFQLPNFPNYILQDLEYKFLSGGNWSGLLWSPGAYVVRHAESNPEKRLENTVNAWAALHSYYCLMNSSMQSEFINLLTGSPTAWQGLVNDSDMHSNGQFRWRTNSGYSDDATCAGAMILFMNGIVPDSGSLAIPVIDENYQDWCSMFPAQEFRFDYASRTIRIPVWQGKINFIFGTETASYAFPSDGVYEVHFSSDWNTVTGANKVSMLDSRFTYIQPQRGLPAHNLNTDLYYAGIQEAIDAAGTRDGDTIYVNSGTYKENVVVNKSITLQGESSGAAIIDGEGASSTVEVTADNVSISGFTLENSSTSCILSNVSGCQVQNNSIVDNGNGILFDNCSGNEISGNTIMNNTCGIAITTSNSPEDANKIFHNNFVNNTAQAVLSDSTNVWDDGFPSGGNYWSDYVEKYPTAAEVNSSGIWNTPYILDAANQDSYPLTAQYVPESTGAKSPKIQLFSPVASATYSTNSVPLEFTVNDPDLTISYSLDGRENVTLRGNTVLNRLYNGDHRLTVYGTDMAGNSIAITADFAVNVPVAIMPQTSYTPANTTQGSDTTIIHQNTPLTVSVDSPQNKTYNVTDIPLNFATNTSVTWIGYSLDGHESVTISRNTTLEAVPVGSHCITVFVNDSEGNNGTSEKIYFTVAQESITEPNPQPPTSLIAVLITIVALATTTAFLVYFKKIKKKN